MFPTALTHSSIECYIKQKSYPAVFGYTYFDRLCARFAIQFLLNIMYIMNLRSKARASK